MSFLVRCLDMSPSMSHLVRAHPGMSCVQVKKAVAPAKTQVGASHNIQACGYAVLRAGWMAQLPSAPLELCGLIVPAEGSHSAGCTLGGPLHGIEAYHIECMRSASERRCCALRR